MEYIKETCIMNYTDSAWTNIVDLSEKSLKYLWSEIENSKIKNISHKQNLAGNISSSLKLEDSKNLLVNQIIPEIIKQNIDFYTNKFSKQILETNLSGFWVNFQKKYEFNPIHSHAGDISFVIWMSIPYDWEDEIELSITKESNTHNAVGNFMFVYAENNQVRCSHITMSPKMNGKMAIFPSYLNHVVYPFYTSDDVRISISGNIHF